ncbi:MAG: hypothetical protein OXN17_00350 [Candidatus Poribacteria bacterium]|nr:hypothetical protein [Candidatus Poribacteria bacterium]
MLDGQNKDLPVVNNLFRVYCYDLPTVTGWNCQDNGLLEGYAFGDLSRSWNDDDECAFVLRVDCRLAGFVLIDDVGVNTLADFNMAEFPILHEFRRIGIGTYVARYQFDQLSGNWEVS